MEAKDRPAAGGNGPSSRAWGVLQVGGEGLLRREDPPRRVRGGVEARGGRGDLPVEGRPVGPVEGNGGAPVRDSRIVAFALRADHVRARRHAYPVAAALTGVAVACGGHPGCPAVPLLVALPSAGGAAEAAGHAKQQ